ncbi:unnamed protein product [Diamesa tonsa]
MDQIADISELCRVCLDSQAGQLIPFFKKLSFTTYSIVDLIHFCTGVLYDDSEEENILPKHLCKPCLQKIKISYELKSKCIESDKYLSTILCSTGPTISGQELTGIELDEASFMPVSDAVEYYDDSMANTEENESTDDHFNDMVTLAEIKKQRPARNMKNSRISTCNICQREFKYSKSYKRHMKEHEAKAKAGTSSIEISDHSNDVSFADCVLDSYRARSRSPSIEIVPEFDAIGEVYKITPDSDDDDDDDTPVLPRRKLPAMPVKFAKPEKTIICCDICDQTFTTAYFLTKHNRLWHPGL